VITLAFALWFSFWNAVRGGHFLTLTKGICFAAMALAPLAYHGAITWLSVSQAVIVGGGLALTMAEGWGKYFVSFTANKNVLHEVEVPWIDAVCDRVFGENYYDYSVARTRAYGWLGMTLRMTYLYAVFLLLLSPVIGLGVLLFGTIYWLNGYMNWQKYGTMFPEIVTGLLLGVMVAESIGG
jgi:hypothetical protein